MCGPERYCFAMNNKNLILFHICLSESWFVTSLSQLFWHNTKSNNNLIFSPIWPHVKASLCSNHAISCFASRRSGCGLLLKSWSSGTPELPWKQGRCIFLRALCASYKNSDPVIFAHWFLIYFLTMLRCSWSWMSSSLEDAAVLSESPRGSGFSFGNGSIYRRDPRWTKWVSCSTTQWYWEVQIDIATRVVYGSSQTEVNDNFLS